MEEYRKQKRKITDYGDCDGECDDDGDGGDGESDDDELVSVCENCGGIGLCGCRGANRRVTKRHKSFHGGSQQEKKQKEKEKGKEKVDDDSVFKDPFLVFGSDIMLRILSRLDANSVAQCLLVTRGWRRVASIDTIWSSKCEELWQGKVHTPRIAKLPGLSKLASYSLSLKDGKRSRITKEDLCDHVWEFHFNQEAPEYWRNLDPYWTGSGPPLRRYFHPDGSLTADPGDGVWGGHESCYSVVTSFLPDGSIREHYVRVNRWPPLSVSRNPNWRWELSNNLFFYCSIPDTEKEEGTGPLYPVF